MAAQYGHHHQFFGNHDTVNGSGNDSITVFGILDVVNGGTGNDTISVLG